MAKSKRPKLTITVTVTPPNQSVVEKVERIASSYNACVFRVGTRAKYPAVEEVRLDQVHFVGRAVVQFHGLPFSKPRLVCASEDYGVVVTVLDSERPKKRPMYSRKRKKTRANQRRSA